MKIIFRRNYRKYFVLNNYLSVLRNFNLNFVQTIGAGILWGELQNGWLSSSSSNQPPCQQQHAQNAPALSLSQAVSPINSPKRISGNCNITNLHEGPSVMAIRQESSGESG